MSALSTSSTGSASDSGVDDRVSSCSSAESDDDDALLVEKKALEFDAAVAAMAAEVDPLSLSISGQRHAIFLR